MKLYIKITFIYLFFASSICDLRYRQFFLPYYLEKYFCSKSVFSLLCLGCFQKDYQFCGSTPTVDKNLSINIIM